MARPSQCKGCRRAAGLDNIDGGIIPLGQHWMANHYQNKDESFLGWLVIQPIKHRMVSFELSREELEEFGLSTERLEEALMAALNRLAPDDKAEIVYLVRLGESTLGPAAEWHLHYHMVPRTSSMKGKCEGWDIVKCRERGIKPPTSGEEIDVLMKHIRDSLGSSSAS